MRCRRWQDCARNAATRGGVRAGSKNAQEEESALADLQSYATDSSMPMKPQRVVWEIRQALGDDDILISDVGAHKLWLSLLYPAAKPNTVIISNGFATMGIALPEGSPPSWPCPTAKSWP